MLKIKKIEFIKVLYDDALAQNIFSIANITFSNRSPIYGALLYWQQNQSAEPYTKEGDYKFFYDLAKAQYFAAVKFPKDCTLTKDERQELAYILLEERGAIGTYSFVTTKPKTPFHLKKAFQAIMFPEHFSVDHFNAISIMEKLESHDPSVYDGLPYERAFLENYIEWCRLAVKQHPSNLTPYLQYLPFSYICYANPFLSEQFLVDYLPRVSLEALQQNKAVLARLTISFKRYLVTYLLKNKKRIHPDFVDQLDDFIESNAFYSSFDVVYLPEADEVPDMDLHYFEYERGNYRWAGSEHLVKGIPSLICQKYNRYGDKRPTNTEMDEKFRGYNAEQKQLFTAIAELHWLNRYRDELDWSYVCQYNEHLTEQFLTAHLNYVDFNALGLNTDIAVNIDFLTTYLHRFNHQKAVPLIICHLTEQFYLTHKDEIKVDIDLLYKYMDNIDEDEFLRIEGYLME
ncbi:nucleoside-diphosphate sugar epimerase [Solibacillus silvestris]|uniref:nucleoside-diphosphate sugar epimerase n=1 Tax=Solibacillus silvestris TaxID=76853 RepID=UPI003F805758